MSKQFQIGESVTIDIALLRTQRDALLEVIEVLANSKPDFIEDIFAFDKFTTLENLDGLVNLCDGILDEAELNND
jgi:hypothetical protein